MSDHVTLCIVDMYAMIVITNYSQLLVWEGGDSTNTVVYLKPAHGCPVLGRVEGMNVGSRTIRHNVTYVHMSCIRTNCQTIDVLQRTTIMTRCDGSLRSTRLGTVID